MQSDSCMYTALYDTAGCQVMHMQLLSYQMHISILPVCEVEA